MLTKIYLTLWAILIAAAAIVFLTGNLTEMGHVVFGFITFGMIFMGMISVLPTSVHDSLGHH